MFFQLKKKVKVLKSFNNKIFNLKVQNNLKSIYSKNKPFKYLIIDNFLKENVAVEFEKSFKINSNWTNYSLVNNFKKYGLKKRFLFKKKCDQTVNDLGSKKFVKILNHLTKNKGLFLDTDLDGGGFHKVLDGGYLNVHVDFTSHYKNQNWKRVLNLLMYFNRDWKKSYNGYLEFYDKKGISNKVSIEPKFNRCVIFNTNETSFHGHPEGLKLPKNVSRNSFAVYYYIETKKFQKSKATYYRPKKDVNIFYNLVVKFENFLLNLYLILKRNKILNDDKITKILNIIKIFSK